MRTLFQGIGVFGYGPGAERIHGNIDNTQVCSIKSLPPLLVLQPKQPSTAMITHLEPFQMREITATSAIVRMQNVDMFAPANTMGRRSSFAR